MEAFQHFMLGVLVGWMITFIISLIILIRKDDKMDALKRKIHAYENILGEMDERGKNVKKW